MKKVLFLAGLCIALLCCALGITACNKKKHVHNWGEWEISIPSTCTEEGEEKRFCANCGAEEFRTTQLTEHTYSKGWTEVKAPTCTEKGREENVCDVCHIAQSRDIDKIPHTWGDWYTITDATCSEEGVQRRDCIVCNEEGDDGKAFETASIKKLPHTETDIEKSEANCIEAGHEAGKMCAVCQEVIEGLEEIPALGHKLGDPVRESESTCTNHGIEEQTCTREGCEYSVVSELPLKDHTRVAIGEEVEATCLSDGKTAGEKCSECDKVFEPQKIIPSLGHDMQSPGHIDKGDGKYWHRESCSRCFHYVDTECIFSVTETEATCTEAEHHVHTCNLCAFKYEHDEGEPLGHKFGDWHFDVEAYDESLKDADGAATVVRQHRRVCTNPGHTPDPEYPEVQACSKRVAGEPVAATCISAGYTNYECGTCESEYTDDKVNALGHDWEMDGNNFKYYTKFYNNQWIHHRKCMRDNCPKPEGTYYACRYLTATYSGATCEKGLTKIMVCEDCKYRVEEEMSEPLGHSYSAWEHKEGTSGELSQHTRQCRRCQSIQTESCVMQSSDKVATCQRPGREISVCKDCKYTEEGDEIEMLNHDVDGQPYIKERTYNRHYRVCKRCKTNVYENCVYNTVTTTKTCTTDAKTTYTCQICNDRYENITEKSSGHEVAEYESCDRYSHSGLCKYCNQQVTVDHDFSESNICSVCKTDGLNYTFLSGSGDTKAVVSRRIKNGFIYNINTPKIVIPETVNIDGKGGVPVVSIGTSAFAGNNSIVEVVLPKSLENISYDAFMNCANLAKVSINGHNAGESGISDCKLNRIENNAFKGCKSLINAILPETLQYIGAHSFENCEMLSEINIPEKVTEIQDFAFHNTAYYNNHDNWHNDVLYIGHHLIEAHDSVKGHYNVLDTTISISAEAFKDCKGLTQITLPAALKAIDKDAFAGCTSLSTVIFKGTFEQYLNIRFDNDAASPMHFASALTIEGAVGAPEIPATATAIPAGAFRGSQIESIVIPASVTSIGANAFRDCAKLTSVKFAAGSNIGFIGADVVLNTPFYETEANWDDGVLYLKDENDTPIALVAVNKDEVTGEYEKYEGEVAEGSYKQVTVKEGTRVIAPLVFENFTELRMITVASTVIYLGPEIVKGCTSLTRVNFRGQNLAWFTFSSSIGRVYTDAELYGGANNENIDAQIKGANMFKLYNGQWKRGNYGSN